MLSPESREQPQDLSFLEGVLIPSLPDPVRPIKRPDLEKYYHPHQYALPHTRKELESLLTEVLRLPDNPGNILSEPPAHIEADLSLPCFTLAKQMRKSPNQIAEQLADTIRNMGVDGIGSVETVGGYLNFRFDETKLGQGVVEDVKKLGDDYGNQNIGEGKTVVIDSSSPNIAKFMSVGHLRSTVIGESLARIYEATGYTVIRDNHLGDWGTQFGMLGRALELWGKEIPEIDSDPVQGLYQLYVRMHEEIERERASNADDSELETEGKEWFKRLESGDPEAKRLLDWATSQSLKEFQKVYDLLGVQFEYMLGESFYVPMLQSVIGKLQKLGIATANDTGAISVDLEGLKLPKLIIQKSDSTSLYSTRDLATLAARTAWFSPEKIIYVVGGEQKDYFRQVFEVFKRWAGDESPTLEHVSFGMITLPEGKMSTRKGRVVFLEDVLNEAISRAHNKTSNDMGGEERKSTARDVGVGAIIYFDLGQGRERNIKFNWDEILNTEGQSAPYIQYAYVRTQAVLAKAQGIRFEDYNEVEFTAPSEIKLIKLIATFPDAVRRAQKENQPTIVAGHVCALADAFNHFYNSDRILNAPDDTTRDSRLNLTLAVGQTLKNGLRLLGIDTPIRM